MNAPSVRPAPRHQSRATNAVKVVLAVMSLAVASVTIAVITLLTNGAVVAALAPWIAALGLLAIWVAPLRYTIAALFFVGLSLDTTADAGGVWHSPLAPLGELLTSNLNKTIPIPALRFSVLALLIGSCVLVHIYRRVSGSSIDGNASRSPSPLMTTGLALSLAAIVGMAGYGFMRGGDLQMMNLEAEIFLLMIVAGFLLSSTLRNARDCMMIGRTIIAAACVKAGLALWVAHVLGSELDRIKVATNHGDSMLFVASLTMLGLALIERRRLRISPILVLFPAAMILSGVYFNTRRLAWVQLALVALTLYLVTPWTAAKRTLTRACLIASPVFLLYVAAGWNSGSPLFAPVQLFRSVHDGDVNRSTLDRDVENFNLVFTMQQVPLLGTGLGHPYVEAVKGDDISRAFAAYRYAPHNSVLWLFVAGGAFAFTAVMAAPLVALFLAARRYFEGGSAEQRVIAFTVIAVMEIYVMQCWGDMGFIDNRALFVVAPAFGAAGFLGASVRSPRRAHLARAA